MKVSELKALSREKLLGKYGAVCTAYVLRRALVFLSVLLSSTLLILGIMNIGLSAAISVPLPKVPLSRTAAFVFLFLAAAGFLFSLLLSVWTYYGLAGMFLNIGRSKKADITDILSMFREDSCPWKVAGTSVLKYVFILLNAVIPYMVYACARICGTNVLIRDFSNAWYIVFVAVTSLSIVWAFYLAFAFTFAELAMIDVPELDILDALRMSMKASKGRKLKLIWMCCFSFLFWRIPLVLVPVSAIWICPYFWLTFVLFYLDGITVKLPDDTDGEEPEEISGPAEETAQPEQIPAAESLPAETVSPAAESLPAEAVSPAAETVQTAAPAEDEKKTGAAAEESTEAAQKEVPEANPEPYEEDEGPVPDLEDKTRKTVHFPDVDPKPEAQKEEQL